MNFIVNMKNTIFSIGRQIMTKRNLQRIYELIENENFQPIENELVSKCKTITFIIPGMRKHSGGRTSILRLGTFLCEYGYQVNYISYIQQKAEDMEECARYNLDMYKGRFYEKDKLNTIKSDIVIATDWWSAYYAKRCKGYKMYFVQDYEPYFYCYGDFFWLAKKTYQFGFHMVSLGEWNKQKIEKECNILGIDVVDFPYEVSEYSYLKRNYKGFQNKKTYKIAVYIKQDGKRLPLITQILLKELKQKFESNGKMLDILFFGMSKSEKVIVGKNIGKLNKNQLQKLYHEVDFGMVASMSNISLIPYEMIASGLPVIEFKDGTFQSFFQEGSAILTSFDYNDLYQILEHYMENPEELECLQKFAYAQLSELSWEKTSRQFQNIIKEVETRNTI